MAHVTMVNPGLGTTLSYGASPTLLGQVLSIDGPDASVGIASTTNLASTAETKRPTLPDLGDLSFVLQYDPQDAGHLVILGLLLSPPQAGEAFVLTFSDTTGTTPSHTAFSFTGVLSKFKPNGMEKDGNLLADVTIAISGLITHSP